MVNISYFRRKYNSQTDGHKYTCELILSYKRRISDDGFWHSLIVYKDRSSGGIRLLAAVWDGPLRQCPVWTAFGSFSPSTSLSLSLGLD